MTGERSRVLGVVIGVSMLAMGVGCSKVLPDLRARRYLREPLPTPTPAPTSLSEWKALLEKATQDEFRDDDTPLSLGFLEGGGLVDKAKFEGLLLSLLGNAVDLHQKVDDQLLQGIDGKTSWKKCTDAECDIPRNAASWSHSDVNVADPPWTPVELPMPLRHDAPNRGDFPLRGIVALQPPGLSRGLIVVVPGVFDTMAQRYVRRTAAYLYGFLGYSVAIFDMRDHGATLRRTPTLPTSAGWQESKDLLTVVRRLQSHFEDLGRAGLLGFSLGGLGVLSAARTALVQGEQARLGLGVLAVSPPLDLRRAIDDLDDKDSKLFHAGEWSIAKLFRQLLRMRIDALCKKGTPDWKPPCGERNWEQIEFGEYLKTRSLKHYKLSEDEFYSLNTAFERKTNTGFLCHSALRVPIGILHAEDDPAIAVGQAKKLHALNSEPKTRLPSVVTLVTEHGGHTSFDITSPHSWRGFLRDFFAVTGGLPVTGEKSTWDEKKVSQATCAPPE